MATPTRAKNRAAARARLVGPQSLRTLGRRAKIDHSYLSRVLNGDRTLSFDAAGRLAKALGISMEELRQKLLLVTGGRAKTRTVPSDVPADR